MTASWKELVNELRLRIDQLPRMKPKSWFRSPGRIVATMAVPSVQKIALRLVGQRTKARGAPTPRWPVDWSSCAIIAAES